MRFSERMGYTKPSDVIIREQITPEIQNAICNCYDRLKHSLYGCFSKGTLPGEFISSYVALEQYFWGYFFNQREASFQTNSNIITNYIEDDTQSWHRKLDLVEETVQILYMLENNHSSSYPYNTTNKFITILNSEFERLNFAYRIVDKEIVEINSEEEIQAIETAIDNSKNNIKAHLSKALELYAQRPDGDFRNSIKESISAVEAFCREKTGESTLGKALSKLESKGIIIPKTLKSAFDKLYEYTNHEDTGIRHSLMDEDGTYVPTAREALFMLVTCSAFINYLNQ
jgi:hypothetical protein